MFFFFSFLFWLPSFLPAFLPPYINEVTVLHGALAAAVLLFCCFDPAPFEAIFHNTSCYPGCFSGGPHAKWIGVAHFIEVWFKEWVGQKGERNKGTREREGSCHKLFYSYPALQMYVGSVNNALPQRIIRTTTLFFQSYSSVSASLMDLEATRLICEKGSLNGL